MTPDEAAVGVLATQGAFAAHAQMLRELGAGVQEVRTPGQLDEVDGLIIPGGESTTIMLGIRRDGLGEPLAWFARSGRPILGTCAGMIVLGRTHLDLMDIHVERNAFGRQVDSFEQSLDVPVLGGDPVHAVFIRAPYVADHGGGVTVLAALGGYPVAVEQDRLLAIAFHPELVGERRFHERFLEHVAAYRDSMTSCRDQ